jgi:CubicO group peptidase (beta-lactamase class C family)
MRHTLAQSLRPALAAAALASAALASAAPCPTRASWPTQEWPSRITEVAASRAQEIQALEEYAFTLVGRDEERLGLRTDGLLIVHQGNVIYERYARGYTASKRHLGWSVTKSVATALAGVAVGEGALAVDDSVCKYVEVGREEACRLTVRHFLEFGTGLDWRETYEHQTYQVSSVLAMLYGEGHRDAVRFVTNHRFAYEPGTHWLYSTGDATVLASVVRGALAARHGEDHAWKLLFDPLGMKTAVIERDAKGNPLGGSFFYATPRDYARFGYLYLNDGCWDGRRILPEGWVQSSSEVSRSAPPTATACLRRTTTPAAGSGGSTGGSPSSSGPSCRGRTCRTTPTRPSATGGSTSWSSPRGTW